MKRHFSSRRRFGDFDFHAMSEAGPDPLLKAWNDLPDDDRKPMEAEFGEIETGFVAIPDEGKWRPVKDPAAFAA